MNTKTPCSKQHVEVLSAVFTNVEQKALCSLYDAAKHVRFDTGDLIEQQGASFTGLYLVVEGVIYTGKYSSTPDKCRVLHILGSGEFFGLDMLFIPQIETHLQFARALTSAECLFIPTDAFLRFLEDNPHSMRYMCNYLAKELARQDYRLTRDAYEGVLSNLAALLLGMAEMKFSVKQQALASIKLSRSLLAAILGSSEITIAKLLKELQNRKIIMMTESDIEILDEAALERLSVETGGAATNPMKL